MEQTILVTGSTSGFGRLTVETLARQGYRVFAGMRAAAVKNAPAAEALRALAQREALALQTIRSMSRMTPPWSGPSPRSSRRLVVLMWWSTTPGYPTVVHWKHSPW